MAQVMDWEEIKKEMIAQKEQAIRDLGNEGKSEREGLTVCAFLRCIEHAFEGNSVKLVNDQFPDIYFGDINFEVKELMDEGRRRLDEYKSDLEAIKRANSMCDLLEQYTPIENSILNVCDKVQVRVNEISSHYSEEARKSVNLLVYFNLADVLISNPSDINKIEFGGKGWSSVSVVGSSWAYVMLASQNAPSFIRDNLHGFKKKYGVWQDCAI